MTDFLHKDLAVPRTAVKAIEAALEKRLTFPTPGSDMISVRAVIDALYVLAATGDTDRAIAGMESLAADYNPDAAATVTFTVADLDERFTGTDDEAAAWFAANKGQIENRLAEYGNQVIDDLLAYPG